jgi:hypothetical protein
LSLYKAFPVTALWFAKKSPELAARAISEVDNPQVQQEIG